MTAPDPKAIDQPAADAANAAQPKWDREVNTSGLRCPLPVLRARRVLRAMAPGQVLRMRATDPAALVDVPHFCVGAGHALLATQTGGEACVFYIRRGPDQAESQGAVPESSA